MPESGDESQGIAVKGLLCRLRPGSSANDLAPVRQTGTLPRRPAPGTVQQSYEMLTLLLVVGPVQHGFCVFIGHLIL